MARPSLRSEKCEIIQQAYEQCVALYGVHGTTLQSVADKAGMARPLIRHYIGNQDELLKACSERFVVRVTNNFQRINQTTNIDELVELLFMPLTDKEFSDMSIYAALASASRDYECLKILMENCTLDCQAQFLTHMLHLFPTVAEKKLQAVVVGLWGISLNYYYTRRLLSDPTQLEESARMSAKMLLDALNAEKD